MKPHLAAATTRLLDTVRDMPDVHWGAPSHCEGWTRSDVVAHVALNAEALAGVLRGHAAGAPATMYRSDAERDADIADLSSSPPATLRDRLAEACAAFGTALDEAGDLPAGLRFERTPGGVTLPLDGVPYLRLREVEIHHADLRAHYSYLNWPGWTATRILEDAARRYDGPGFHAWADGGHLELAFGTPGADAPVVTGPVNALAWWATGRDPGPVVSSSTGTLPSMEGR